MQSASLKQEAPGLDPEVGSHRFAVQFRVPNRGLKDDDIVLLPDAGECVMEVLDRIPKLTDSSTNLVVTARRFVVSESELCLLGSEREKPVHIHPVDSFVLALDPVDSLVTRAHSCIITDCRRSSTSRTSGRTM